MPWLWGPHLLGRRRRLTLTAERQHQLHGHHRQGGRETPWDVEGRQKSRLTLTGCFRRLKRKSWVEHCIIHPRKEEIHKINHASSWLHFPYFQCKATPASDPASPLTSSSRLVVARKPNIEFEDIYGTMVGFAGIKKDSMILHMLSFGMKAQVIIDHCISMIF